MYILILKAKLFLYTKGGRQQALPSSAVCIPTRGVRKGHANKCLETTAHANHVAGLNKEYLPIEAGERAETQPLT